MSKGGIRQIVKFPEKKPKSKHVTGGTLADAIASAPEGGSWSEEPSDEDQPMTVPDELVERVARVYDDFAFTPQGDERSRKIARQLARAAILETLWAVSETPVSQAMVDAWNQKPDKAWDLLTNDAAFHAHATRDFRAMLDHLIKEIEANGS